MISYEYPLSERVRTWLRLEDLFSKSAWFRVQEDARDHQIALLAIFELIEVTARPDLKSELLQEIERQRQSLAVLRDNPAVDSGRLDEALAEIARIHGELLAMTGKMCQELRENEWLSGIRNRSFIPGATCSFDMPSYHYWLSMPVAARQADLTTWIAPLKPLEAAVQLVLRLLREGRQSGKAEAVNGVYQLALGGRNAQLLGIHVPENFDCVPEISAGKHAINIRFVQVDKQHRPRLCEQSIEFVLTI